jgi:Fe-S cluster assembly protein SufD
MKTATKKISTEERLATEFESILPNLAGAGNEFFERLRQESFKRFQNLGIPDRKNEQWKYTNIRRVFNQGYSAENIAEITSEAAAKAKIENLNADTLLVVNGKVDWENSSLTDYEVRSLTAAQADYSNEYSKHFSKIAPTESSAMVALNTAFFADGFFIRLKTNVEKPLHVIHYVDADQALINFRAFVMTDKSASGQIVESFVGAESAAVYNYTTETYLAENANLDWVKIQNEGGNVHWIDNGNVSEERYAVFNINTLSLDNEFVRNDLNISLDAENCETHLYGVYLTDGQQHVDNHTRIDHRFSNCPSNEHYKGVISGKGTAVFNGKVHVHRDAQKTNAFQANNNILLSDDATINSKPELEIYADDVKCSHGSTTGQLDEDALFYLRARGLSRESATTLLLNAFAEEVLENVKGEELKSHLKGLVENRLRNLK